MGPQRPGAVPLVGNADLDSPLDPQLDGDLDHLLGPERCFDLDRAPPALPPLLLPPRGSPPPPAPTGTDLGEFKPSIHH